MIPGYPAFNIYSHIAENIEEALNSYIDYVVIGEGEETIKELLNALENKKIYLQ